MPVQTWRRDVWGVWFGFVYLAPQEGSVRQLPSLGEVFDALVSQCYANCRFKVEAVPLDGVVVDEEAV